MSLLLEMKGIQKSFYGNQVLHAVDFSLEKGSVHALMGENGAGKSTLMNILVGIHKRDGGTVKIEGKEVEIDSPAVAQKMGIAMIHQELSSVVEMSVAENIYLGREPVRHGFIDYRQMYKQTGELLEMLHIKLNPRAKMGSLRVADQQLVEIAKAVSQDARILIMDEPTSSITDREVENLYKIIRDLQKRGTGIVYISHKMDEVYEITDKITILRDGESIATWETKEATNDMVVKAMVGRELTEQYPKREAHIGEPILELKGLTRAGEFEDINLTLHKGEILGLVGLVGAGRTELMQALFGLTRLEKGEIILKGQKVEKTVDGGLTVLIDKQKPERQTPIVPAGALSARHFAQHCTACQLCVSVCPNEVLRPSTDLMKLMQPEMSYERGYCRPECVKCAEVCPAGAIQPITLAEKSAIQIGQAVWRKDFCVPLIDGVECDNCARHCPTAAILMVPSDANNPDSPKIPAINVEKCIGCGACEALCPARPHSAIYVEGLSAHREI